MVIINCTQKISVKFSHHLHVSVSEILSEQHEQHRTQHSIFNHTRTHTHNECKNGAFVQCIVEIDSRTRENLPKTSGFFFFVWSNRHLFMPRVKDAHFVIVDMLMAHAVIMKMLWILLDLVQLVYLETFVSLRRIYIFILLYTFYENQLYRMKYLTNEKQTRIIVISTNCIAVWSNSISWYAIVFALMS